MRILDKYILRSFFGPFIFGVCAFTAVFMGTGTLYRVAQYITDYGASVWSVTKIFFLSLPSIIVLTFPMSTLLGSLMTFGRLSSTSEIIVMRSGGQQFLRLAAPVYILCFFISIFSTFFNEYVVPVANHQYQVILREEIRKVGLPKVENNIVLPQIVDNQMKALLYASKYNSEKKELQNITIQEFNNEEVVRVERATSARWENDRWIMQNGTIYDLTGNDGVQRTMTFNSQEMPINIAPNSIHKVKKKFEEMTIKELRTEALAYKASGISTKQIELEIYGRFAIPLASFVFALVGACLGLQPQRASSSMGLGISVVIIFIYYGIMTLMQAFGKSGVMPVALAAFFPDLLAFAFGIYLNWRVSK